MKINIRIIFFIWFFLISSGLFIHSQQKYYSNLFTYQDTLNSLKFLSGEISNVIRSANLKKTDYTVAVFSLDNDKYYFKKSTNKPLVPASITKIFTSYASIFKFGEKFQYRTTISYDGTLEKGIINGNLYIQGSGDPFFNSDDLKSMVKELKNRGIKEIKGKIIADGTIFDNLTNRLDYSGDKDIVQAIAPITGLSINQNKVTVIVSGYPQGAKKHALVTTDPPSSAFQIQNTATVKGRNKPTRRKSDNENGSYKNQEFGGSNLNSESSQRKTVSIKQYKTSSGAQNFKVSGYINADDSYSYSYFINDPVNVISGSLYYLLKKEGIKIDNGFEVFNSETMNRTERKVLTDYKRPLLDVLIPCVKNSDNYLAENVYKLIGANFGNMIENAKDSRIIMSNLFDSLEIDYKDCILYDGSGLSRRNNLTSDAVIGLLNSTWNSPYRHILDSTLSIAGFDGTLEKRMVNTLAQNNVKGKTGTHKNVSGLCGIVKTLDGENLAFCFIFNGWSVGQYKQLENSLAITLAEFFYFNKEE